MEKLDDLRNVSGLHRDFGDEPLHLGKRLDGDFLDIGGTFAIAVFHGEKRVLDIRCGEDQRRADVEAGGNQIEARRDIGEAGEEIFLRGEEGLYGFLVGNLRRGDEVTLAADHIRHALAGLADCLFEGDELLEKVDLEQLASGEFAGFGEGGGGHLLRLKGVFGGFL